MPPWQLHDCVAPQRQFVGQQRDDDGDDCLPGDRRLRDGSDGADDAGEHVQLRGVTF